MQDIVVKMPLARILEVCLRVGSQEHDLCPSEGHICWRHRDLTPYDASLGECESCWLHYFMQGQ